MDLSSRNGVVIEILRFAQDDNAQVLFQITPGNFSTSFTIDQQHLAPKTKKYDK
jgi:hypothetical protein